MTPTGSRSLRTQLLLSFAAVALVALTAAAAAVVWLMLDYRTQATTQRLGDAGMGAGAAGSMLERQGLTPEAIASGVASQVPLPAARVLVLDASGTVVAEAAVNATDTGESSPPLGASVSTAGAADPATASLTASLRGRKLDVPVPVVTPAGGPPLPGGRRSSLLESTVVWRGDRAAGQSGYLFVAAPVRPPGPAPAGRAPFQIQGPPPSGAAYRVVLAVPRDSLPSAWGELAPGLAAAMAIALLAAGGVAWWLTGSIARPIRAVTGAAERIARGEPHQPIPEEGVQEVTQLARSFNTMVGAVERSHRTLREFVANASHELRTPLTAIQGFSQAVEDGVLEAPEPTRDAVGHIHREADRMRRMVEDLLLLSRVESRDREPSRELVDLAELLDTLGQRVMPAVRERGQRMDLDLPDRLETTGDATQLEHLFKNLLDNAIKYAPEGAAITVRTASRPDGTTVSVHNTGSVIAPESLPRVFERFYRADKSRSRKVVGSGLGLAIAHEVVERHGGTIRVDSEPETGTTFTVTLPAAVPPPSAISTTPSHNARSGKAHRGRASAPVA